MPSATRTPTTLDLTIGANVDAPLISLCWRLIDLETEVGLLVGTAHTLDDERRIERRVTALYKRMGASLEAIEGLCPPATMAGIEALACAALAVDFEEPVCQGHRLALIVCECLAGHQL